MNLQAMAMVQLGKVTNPQSGELERDLEGARGTIDILEMLKAKCRTDTPDELLKMLDQAVLDLQMNYLDEMKSEAKAKSKAEPEPEKTESEKPETETAKTTETPEDTNE